MKTAIILNGLLASAVTATALPQVHRRQEQAPSAGCADVHILVARASGEAKGEGMIGGLSRAIKSAVKGADSEAVDYPAALAPYGSSEGKGVAAAKAQLTAYVQKCPKAKVVLMGYSQGADVMGSILCGGGAHNSTKAIGRLPSTNVNLGPESAPVEPSVGSHGKLYLVRTVIIS
jgi:acetylxylan esterase